MFIWLAACGNPDTQASTSGNITDDTCAGGQTFVLKYSAESYKDDYLGPSCEANQVHFVFESGTVTWTENALGQLSAPQFRSINDEFIAGDCSVTVGDAKYAHLDEAVAAGVNFLNADVSMSCTFGVGIVTNAKSKIQ